MEGNLEIVKGVLINYEGNDTDVIIPSNVRSIVNYAFYHCSKLKSITIPRSVIKLGEFIFKDCKNLTDIYYGGTIADWCKIKFGIFSYPMEFAKHFYLKGADDEWEKVTSIEIPKGSKKIGVNQFAGFKDVTSITIPNGVKSIGAYAFYRCESLKSVTIPASLKKLDVSVFEDCINLESVYYEGTIADWCRIKFDIFANPMEYASHFYLKGSDDEWEEVTSIELPKGLKKIGPNQFFGFKNVTAIKIFNGVKSIGNFAFSNCLSLSSINIPSGVKSMGEFVFSGCVSLVNITIPSSVKSMDRFAFHSCGKLESITIPDSLKYIEHYVFYKCSSLSSITLSHGVICIGKSVFLECFNLTDVYYEGNEEEWNNIKFMDEYSNPMCYAKNLHFKK